MKYLLLFFLSFLCQLGSGQTPLADFSISGEALCADEQKLLINASSDAVNFLWDLCDQDFAGTTSTKLLRTVDGAGRVLGFATVYYDGIWYGFATSWNRNRIFRLAFGSGVDNAPTEILDLGNPNNLLSGPVSIHVVNRGQNWYLLVFNWANTSLLRIELGDDLLNPFQSASIITPSNGGFKMAVVDTPEELKVGIIQSNGSVRIIDLQNDPEHVVTSSDIILTPSISGVASSRDMTFAFRENKWYAFVGAHTPARIYRLEFGANIMNGLTAPPAQITSEDFNGHINNIELTESGSGYYLHAATLEGGLFKINLPEVSSSVLNGNIIQYGQAIDYKEGYVLKFIKHQGKWHGFTFQDNLGANPKLYSISSEYDCGANMKFSEEINPIVSYSKPGTYPITLTAVGVDGQTSRITKQVTVSSSPAPSVDFEANTFCESSPVNFVVSSDLALVSYDWSLGDSNSSVLANPGHQYALAGDYMVSLEVASENGCKNFRQKEIKVYASPTSSFTLPTTLLCTNNEFLFPTTTPDTYDGHLSYQWYIDDSPVSTERDLKYTFTNTGPKQIRLKTSIPGCSNEITKTTSTVQAGPVVDFSYAGTCEDESFSFQNEITDAVDSYYWDFGSSVSSNEPSAVHTFSDYGDYPVSLTAVNAIGCATIERKTVIVHANPLVGINIQGPPNACSETITFFENQTSNPDSRPITQWLWQFNDPLDIQPDSRTDGQHVFTQPGTYPVSLTATTEAGCTATVEKHVTIHPSPSTAFSFTPTCEDVPVYFKGPDDPIIESSYWEFGTSYSYEASPTYTFAAPGDYRLYAKFYGNNGCISTIEDVIHVPVPLSPNFSVLRNCVNHEAVFTNTTQGDDPVTDTHWTFSNATSAAGSPVMRTFTQQGTETVTLRVTTQSGCAYEKVMKVEIVPEPIAEFSAAPDAGAYPLEVMFTNTSSQANRFHWDFMDGSGNTSDARSPVYTFSELGSFDVRLTAYNAQECEDTFVKAISTVAPLPDADIEKVTLVENPDGTTKLVVTIHNKGNTILKDLPLTFDFSGNLSLQETMPDVIAPGARYNFVLDPSIQNMQASRYLCVSLAVHNDLSPEGNRSCSGVNTPLSVFPAYPNPANDDLRLEWITNEAGNVVLSLVDQLGRQVFKYHTAATKGLNTRLLDLQPVPPGVYLLFIESKSSKIGQRIVVVE